MPRPTDIRLRAATVWFLPVRTRLPLEFGPETLTSVTCARARERSKTGGAAAPWACVRPGAAYAA